MRLVHARRGAGSTVWRARGPEGRTRGLHRDELPLAGVRHRVPHAGRPRQAHQQRPHPRQQEVLCLPLGELQQVREALQSAVHVSCTYEEAYRRKTT